MIFFAIVITGVQALSKPKASFEKSQEFNVVAGQMGGPIDSLEHFL
jgi:hypothetical protein